jgi:hypothetical protein
MICKENTGREEINNNIPDKHTEHLLMLLTNQQTELNVLSVMICIAFLIQ